MSVDLPRLRAEAARLRLVRDDVLRYAANYLELATCREKAAVAIGRQIEEIERRIAAAEGGPP